MPCDLADSAQVHALLQEHLDNMYQLSPPEQVFALVQAARTALPGTAVHRGLVISGDRFVSTTAESRALQSELPDALAIEMEGAAFAQVCHDYGVPFAAVRTVSDRADDEAHGDFVKFVQEVASRHSAVILEALLQRLRI